MVSGEVTLHARTVTCFFSLSVHCAFSECSPASFMCQVHFWTWLQVFRCPSSFALFKLLCLFGCFQLQLYDCSLQPILLLCFTLSFYLALKAALCAALPDLGGKTTGCRKLPSDSESWGLEWDPSNLSDLMAFQNWSLHKGGNKASKHRSLGTYLFLQCCVVDLLPICFL